MGIQQGALTRSVAVLGVALACSMAAAADPVADGKVIAQATGGQMTALKGKYVESACGGPLPYTARIVDLNGDGQPEVFTDVEGTCMGGMAGNFTNLYIKGQDGRWRPQFGFPGIVQVLKTKNRGYPDIEIGGPGMCFPVWRWSGQQYAIHKKCP